MHVHAIKSVKDNCEDDGTSQGILSRILLAKIFYGEDNLDEAYTCLISAIMTNVDRIEVNRYLNY